MHRGEISVVDDRSEKSTDLYARVADSMERARNCLLEMQTREGYWVGELKADASVTAGYIPLMFYMTGRIDQERKEKAIRLVTGKQRQDGSWSCYFDGPGDINVSIQCYFALKLGGLPFHDPRMEQARRFILEKGGIITANTLTKIWLALFGQYKWQDIPSVPPEMMLLPDWFYLNIYEFASWSRATLVALIVVLSKRSVCKVPDSANIFELYVDGEDRRDHSQGKVEKLFSWKRFFLLLDSILKIYETLPFKPLRRIALDAAERWIVAHQESDGSWGGIMLPWVYSLFALKSIGYSLDHPVIARGMQGLDDFIIEDSETLRLQPATSPVWDTAWSILAIRESGLPSNHPCLLRAARWLLKKEITTKGDWRVKNPATNPGGWSFEFENELYPDIDDSSVVPRALMSVVFSSEEEQEKLRAINRALNWVLDMQSRNGGWAAFDRDNNRKILRHVPYADFMTPLDPTSPDVTAHVIELLAKTKKGGNTTDKALQYLESVQQHDGAWYGRWGVNYIYGTSLVLISLKSIGKTDGNDCIKKAAAWLKSKQNADGGWGESCESYSDPRLRGTGKSTASQTAWAILGLVAAGESRCGEVLRGIGFLTSTQIGDGSWKENHYTGTGFPRAFYLRYDLYRIYFPLLALAAFQRSTSTTETSSASLSTKEMKLARIVSSDRILLLPHCLRRSATCQAKYGSKGLECNECNDQCPVNILRDRALSLGYRGVCVAPGGSMALAYVKETKPRGILAVACDKELKEGVEGVTSTFADSSPVIVVVPLTKKGCLDTEVDLEYALEKVALGYGVESTQIRLIDC